jgi:hypothetical protein
MVGQFCRVERLPADRENVDTHHGPVTAFLRVSPGRPAGSVRRLASLPTVPVARVLYKPRPETVS